MRSCTAMNSFPRPLEFVPGLWDALMRDLYKRGEQTRETGAFLCSSRDSSPVCRWITYDEVDPASVEFPYIRLASAAFGRLAEVCSAESLLVVADIHTHPGVPRQSRSDRRHPMIGLAGYVALIAPRYARGDVRPRDVSFNFYCGDYRWRSYFGPDAGALIVAN